MKIFAIIAACLLSLSACNTFQGLGRDVEAAGEGITGAASKTKEEINKN